MVETGLPSSLPCSAIYLYGCGIRFGESPPRGPWHENQNQNIGKPWHATGPKEMPGMTRRSRCVRASPLSRFLYGMCGTHTISGPPAPMARWNFCSTPKFWRCCKKGLKLVPLSNTNNPPNTHQIYSIKSAGNLLKPQICWKSAGPLVTSVRRYATRYNIF